MGKLLTIRKAHRTVENGRAPRLLFWTVMAFILLAGSAWGFTCQAPPSIGVELKVDEAKLNEPLVLTVTLWPPRDYRLSQINAYLWLPSGAAYLDGFYQSTGPLTEKLTLTTRLAFVERGNWELGVVALAAGPYGPSGEGRLYFEITERSGRLLRRGEKSDIVYRPHDTLRYWLYYKDPYLFAPRLYGHMITGGELLNRYDQPFFLLVHDEAGREAMRQQDLIPGELWGEWDRIYYNIEGFAYADLNAVFLIALMDRWRPTTGYRAWIDRVEAGSQELSIYGRFEPPAPGLPVVSRPVSPYDIVLLEKRQWGPGQPVRVRFFVNEELTGEETIVIRKPYQVVEHEGYEQRREWERSSIEKGITRLSERFDIAAANLAPDGGGEYRYLQHLGIAIRRAVIRDGSTGKTYSYEFDAYGREIEFDKLVAADTRTAQLLRSGRLEPAIARYNEEDLIPVEIWLLAGFPGTTYNEVSAPLAAALDDLGIEGEASEKVPLVRVRRIPKRIAIELAAREDVAFVGLWQELQRAVTATPAPAAREPVGVPPVRHADISLVPDVDASGYAIVRARVERVKETRAGDTYAVSEGIRAFDANLAYDRAGLTVTGVAITEPFGYSAINPNAMGGGTTYFNAFVATALGPLPPLNAAELRLRLKGSKNNAYGALLSFVTIATPNGDDIPQTAPASLVFRRGDADNSGAVTIKDAMAIAQYLAGTRAAGTESTMINPVNAASVRQDDGNGDRIDASDALFIAQMLAGMRDAFYNWAARY